MQAVEKVAADDAHASRKPQPEPDRVDENAVRNQMGSVVRLYITVRR